MGRSQRFIASFSDVQAARANLRRFITKTDVRSSVRLSEVTGYNVKLKLENQHYTRAFKERGALNFLLNLKRIYKNRKFTVCAASAGNHALGLAYHASRLEIDCVVVVPRNAPSVKIQTVRSFGPEVILFGKTFDEARDHALNLSKEHGYEFVSAYDHQHVIAGQGTIGLELLEQTDDFDCIVAPVGGGGLISGIALAIKNRRPNVTLVGVRSDWVVNKRYLDASKQPLKPVTIAEGIGVKTLGENTEKIIKKYVDKMIVVSEAEIAEAMMRYLDFERMVVEGAGAASLCPLLSRSLPRKVKKPLIVVSGSNVDLNLVQRLIARDLANQHRVVKLTLSIPDRPGCLETITRVFADCGANVLDVIHDRSFAFTPGNVGLTTTIEVQDSSHKKRVLSALRKAGLKPKVYGI